jgi:uncharacterized membrane protein
MSFAFMGVGNLLTRGFLSDVLFYSFFPLYTVVGSAHQDQRVGFHPDTSLLPFAAVLEGKQDLKKALNEMNPKAAAVAIMSGILFL